MTRRSRSREPQPGAGRLDRETVIDATLALIAAAGIDGLSMRQLGRALGVEAMSLYHWFPSKERLLDAAADRLLAQVIVPPTPTAASWRDWLIAVGQSYRRVGLAQPRAFPLLATRRLLSPGATAFLRANIAAHLAAGFSVREALRATRSLGAFVNGMVLAEVAPTPTIASPAATPARREPLDGRQWGETVAALRAPALDGAFDYGLACLLDGLERRQPGVGRRLHALREPGARPQKLR
ncbi:TetR family transcriptional regulator [Reyranella sp.]|uniref:TetR family transcriptional regulator n=1 Tax=Reyranella sp. TaxID=1929291 RepID=UPI0037845BEB